MCFNSQLRSTIISSLRLCTPSPYDEWATGLTGRQPSTFFFVEVFFMVKCEENSMHSVDWNMITNDTTRVGLVFVVLVAEKPRVAE